MSQELLCYPLFQTTLELETIHRGVLLQAGEALNLAKGTAERLLENLRHRVMPEAETLYAEVEVDNARIVQTRPELAATLAGELRCLRAILHTVLKEMTKQIA